MESERSAGSEFCWLDHDDAVLASCVLLADLRTYIFNVKNNNETCLPVKDVVVGQKYKKAVLPASTDVGWKEGSSTCGVIDSSAYGTICTVSHLKHFPESLRGSLCWNASVQQWE